jgi:FtsZ-interacting cell division protein YlmF
MGLDIKGMFGLDDKTEEIDIEQTASTSVDGSNKMMLLEPRAFSESQQIADYLKKHTAVVVNMKRVTPELARRIVDFLRDISFLVFILSIKVI